MHWSDITIVTPYTCIIDIKLKVLAIGIEPNGVFQV